MPQNHKLLIVDDERDVLTVTVFLLEKSGFLVDSFTNPIKALAHFEKHANEYSLILSDVRMPGMTGMEFLNFIKRIRPDIPVMVMTAYSDVDDDIVRAVPWIRKEDIMHKPFKASEISNAVKRTLKVTV